MKKIIAKEKSLNEYFPDSHEIEASKKRKIEKPSKEKLKKIIDKGAIAKDKGIIAAKKAAVATKDGIGKVAVVATKKGKEVQMNVLEYVDKKKNARFLEAKLSAFQDGLREGKIVAVEEIKKYTNYCLATVALSYYFARVDGNISSDEMLQINFNVNAIVKNKDLPDPVKNELAKIQNNSGLSFEDVSKYLDGVSIETLQEFSKDIDEIIYIDGNLTDEENSARAEFIDYVSNRLEDSKK